MASNRSRARARATYRPVRHMCNFKAKLVHATSWGSQEASPLPILAHFGLTWCITCKDLLPGCMDCVCNVISVNSIPGFKSHLSSTFFIWEKR